MITVAPEIGVTPRARINIAFSSNGRWGVSMSTQDENRLVLEQWSLASAAAACQPLPEVAVDRLTTPLALDDGGILLLRSKGTPTASARQTVVLLRRDDRGLLRQRLADIPALAGYLVPSPDSAELGLLITLDDPEWSTVWRLSDRPPHIEAMVRVPGSLSGGVWLDGEQGLLAVNQAGTTHGCSGLVVDLRQRSWQRVWSVSDTSVDRIVLASPRTKLLVVTTTSGGAERLGWGVLGNREVRFPETLRRAGYPRQALALDGSGERLLLREVVGAVSRLLVYRPADDHLAPLAAPPGNISAPVSWTGDVIRLRFSAPDQPPTLATVQLQAGQATRWLVRNDDHDDDPHDGPKPWASAELVELSGPAGPMEAIVYGGPDWRSCPNLVLALHGGPLAAWRFEFDLLFQSLARAGVAVVAPNYRGSTGYGDAYLRAVVGHWGGPDLEDVLFLGRHLLRERAGSQLAEPVVLGASYGAFLALLAACHEPRLWSGCVALAPFLSGPSLHECAGSVVRNRVEQLGGLRSADDALGPRDVLRSCASLSVPLLLVHGSRDETIPVRQSRLLLRRLSELGRTAGCDDLEYLETDGDHEDVALAWPRALRRKVVSFCLARTGP